MAALGIDSNVPLYSIGIVGEVDEDTATSTFSEVFVVAQNSPIPPRDS
jgi:hypothetical protein